MKRIILLALVSALAASALANVVVDTSFTTTEGFNAGELRWQNGWNGQTGYIVDPAGTGTFKMDAGNGGWLRIMYTALGARGGTGSTGPAAGSFDVGDVLRITWDTRYTFDSDTSINQIGQVGIRYNPYGYGGSWEAAPEVGFGIGYSTVDGLVFKPSWTSAESFSVSHADAGLDPGASDLTTDWLRVTWEVEHTGSGNWLVSSMNVENLDTLASWSYAGSAVNIMFNNSDAFLALRLDFNAGDLFTAQVDAAKYEYETIPEPVDLYVATNGNDSNPGTEALPLATLKGARDVIRSQGLATSGVTVHLREGSYQLSSTFSLSSQDSGIAGYPAVYQSYPGEEVIIHGAEILDPATFYPVTDPAILNRLPQAVQNKVLVCDLSSQGITDFGQLSQAHDHTMAPAELFFNERTMTLAQWPNEGFTLSGQVIRVGSLDPYEGAIFEYTDPRIEGWSSYDDVWVGGHWNVEMYDSMKIVAVDTVADTIETLQPPLTWGSAKIKNNRRMFYLNVLEELDIPTEYYIDRTAGKLYFYPPDTMTGSKIQLSMLNDKMFDLDNVNYVQFKNLTFEASRDKAIGTSSSSNIGIYGCVFRNVGDTSISCWLGEDIEVFSSDFYEIGHGGVRTFGGDYETLTHGNHKVENCHFYNYSRLRRTGSWPTRLERVGHQSRHHLVHGTWRSGFSFPGNDHLFEFNEVNNIMKNSNDTSGCGSGFNWAGSGTDIRYNFFHNYHGVPTHSIIAIGVYVDDGLSGNNVYQNVFYDLDMGFFSHGGRATVVDNNLMIDCDRSFNFMDPSLVTWWDSRFATLIQKLNDRYALGPDVQSLYESRYPHLVTISADLAAHDAEPGNIEYQYPKENVGTKNLIYNSGTPEIPANALDYGTFSDNYEMADGADAGFIDPGTLNFGLEPTSPVYSLIPGFQDIPFDQIGLYTDQYRTELPSLGDFKLFLPETAALVSNGSSIDFTWQSCQFADEYQLEIATDPEFSNIIRSINKEDMCYSYAVVTVDDLLDNDVYYWRVRAFTNSRSMNLDSKYNSGEPSFVLIMGDWDCEAVIAAGQGLDADLSGPAGVPDCYVNSYDLVKIAELWVTATDMDDFSVLSAQWMQCNDPQNGSCTN